MDAFIQEVKTTKKVQNNIHKFESLSLNENKNRSRSNSNSKPRKPVVEIDTNNEPLPLLTAVSTKSTKKNDDSAVKTREPRQDRLKTTARQHERKDSAIFIQKDYLKQAAPPSLADDAREILKSQPGIEDIEAVLAYIQYGIEGQHEFNIKVTGPKSSLLVRALVTTTLPDLWPNLASSKIGGSTKQMRKTLLEALFSVTGLEALLEQIRMLTRPEARPSPDNLNVYVDFLGHLLHKSDTVSRLLNDSTHLYEKDVHRRLFWQSIVSLLAGSKVLSTTAAIPNIIAQTGSDLKVPEWLLQGQGYSAWLASNIIKTAIELSPQDASSWSVLVQLFKRGLSLGYKDAFVTKVYTSLLLGPIALWSPLHQLIRNLPTHDQKVVFNCILNDLVRTHAMKSQHLASNTVDVPTMRTIAGVAGLVYGLTSHNEYLLECAIDWVSSAGGAPSRSSSMRRALIVVLAQSQGKLEVILERTLTTFSDKLQIQHAATTQQEHLAQTILLVIGYLNRQNRITLKQDPIPTLVMRSVSNRLASSVPQTRLLGMIVGVGMSRCVDEPDKVMDFHVEEMETAEVKEMLGLVDVEDQIGELEGLKHLPHSLTTDNRALQKRKSTSLKPSNTKKLQATSKIMTIEEVSSSSDDEDDLVPYQKRLDDPEDSDEDPTLVNRDKPRPPIYIVDLIKQLQSPSDKLDIISLALETAASLIRRKAGFGTELFDNIYNLASALINLQDGMSKHEHQQQRLDALVACMVAQPVEMGKYLTSTYFEGEFSLSQRSTLLVAIGLGAREVAGFRDAKAAQAQAEETDNFPSRRLPPHLQLNAIPGGQETKPQKLVGTSNPIAMLTNTATQDTIHPMAVAAAESQSGPEILKVTRTSSRLTLNRDKTSQQRKKNTPSNIHTILANNIYIRLASPLAAILSYTSTSTGSSISTLMLHSSTLTLHLQTLTLLLHTLGPTGLSTPSIYASIIHETLTLLTALHQHRVALDGIVLPAMLGLFLALIDITAEIGVTAQERLLADPFGLVVSELVKWVSGLDGSGRAPPPMKDGDGRGGEGVAWVVLAAGIQVRWYEMGRKFQGRILGLTMDD
ncbi:telomere binding protein [Lithohypha guttulata]|uniref:Telomere binding protein n=1 Tax=Lithohypha guttulata TaxID=1690604 RepID=A0AAN7YIK3_9EURO|nr:telomere binding protein [Lithohypha guttulata]